MKAVSLSSLFYILIIIVSLYTFQGFTQSSTKVNLRNTLESAEAEIKFLQNQVNELKNVVNTKSTKVVPSPISKTEVWKRGLLDPGLYKLLRQNFWFNLLRPFERKVFSQNGEDGILERIFNMIGTTDKFFVEIGTQDGMECNTRYLREKMEWTGYLFDDSYNNPKINLIQKKVTKENIKTLFDEYKIPEAFDLLSIDIDSYDYDLREVVGNAGYKPRIVVHEVNTLIDPRIWRKKSQNQIGPQHHYTNFGASLSAFDEINRRYGYLLLYCDSVGVNCYFIRKDLIGNDEALRYLESRPLEVVYRPMNLGGIGRRHDIYSEHLKNCKEPSGERFFRCFSVNSGLDAGLWDLNETHTKRYLESSFNCDTCGYNKFFENW